MPTHLCDLSLHQFQEGVGRPMQKHIMLCCNHCPLETVLMQLNGPGYFKQFSDTSTVVAELCWWYRWWPSRWPTLFQCTVRCTKIQCNFRQFQTWARRISQQTKTNGQLNHFWKKVKLSGVQLSKTVTNLSKWLISLLHGFTVKADRRKDTSTAGNEGVRGYYGETIIGVVVGTNWC